CNPFARFIRCIDHQCRHPGDRAAPAGAFRAGIGIDPANLHMPGTAVKHRLSVFNLELFAFRPKWAIRHAYFHQSLLAMIMSTYCTARSMAVPVKAWLCAPPPPVPPLVLGVPVILNPLPPPGFGP